MHCGSLPAICELECHDYGAFDSDLEPMDDFGHVHMPLGSVNATKSLMVHSTYSNQALLWPD